MRVFKDILEIFTKVSFGVFIFNIVYESLTYVGLNQLIKILISLAIGFLAWSNFEVEVH